MPRPDANASPNAAADANADANAAATTSAAATAEPALLQLRDILRDELIAILDTVRAAKALVLDRDLAGALSSIVDFGLLKDHGVDRIFLLDDEPSADALPAGVIFFSLPHVRKMKLVAAHVRRLSAATASASASATATSAGPRDFSLQLVPRRTLLCERVLEEEGVLGDLAVGEFRMHFIPLEADLLSLELPSTFAELYLDADFSAIGYVARALMRLQAVYGFFPRILGKGDYAAVLADAMLRMRREVLVSGRGAAPGAGLGRDAVLATSRAFDSVVIIDRAVDLVTPLLTQLTYEGLVGEVFGITSGHITLPAAAAAAAAANTASSPQPSSDAAPKRKRLPLNSGDPVFRDIRDMNFSSVGALLSKMSRQLQLSYESRHSAKTVQEIRSFVGALPSLQAEHQSLKTHVALAEAIVARTQEDDFNALLDIEQTLVAGADLGKEQMAYLDKMLSLADPGARGAGVAAGNGADAAAPAGGAPQYSIHRVLRVMCLYALCRGPAAVKQKMYDAWYDEVIAAFGHHHTITMDNLSRAGLLPSPQSAAAAAAAADAAAAAAAPTAPASAAVSTADVPASDAGLLNTLVPSTRPRHSVHTNPQSFLRKALNLVVTDVRESDPDDISYVYSGYAPLSVRLVQCLARDPAVYSAPTSSRYADMLLRPLALTLQAGRPSATPSVQSGDMEGSPGVHAGGGVKSGWGGWEDVLAELPGETVDVSQELGVAAAAAAAAAGVGGHDDVAEAVVRRLGEKPPATLVVFLGGCTHTEVSALRLLSQLHNHRYIAATTQIINGNTFLDSLIQHAPV
ncbi:Vacuolar protein-sorting-associated protein 33 [Coemansia erecta]|uniref:Vacuolar protein-sorting-associated protein 33 n=1 Tax=Coemansia erecta TaxID=147472 RepID=A0A9W7XZ51_9FUNG|nr:Vacuolar protein-sorting-associated protein 33 [Coemansia erecta]